MEFFELTTTFHTPSAKHYHRFITSEYRRAHRKGIRLIDAIINAKSYGNIYYIYGQKRVKRAIKEALKNKDTWSYFWALEAIRENLLTGSPYQPRH